MNTDTRITIFGGTGFIGQAIVHALLESHTETTIIIASRSKPRQSLKHPRIQTITINQQEPLESHSQLFSSSTVINCVGLLYEQAHNTFEHAHVKLPKQIAEACSRYDVKNFIHLSALGADIESASEYARTKAMGEACCQQAFPKVIIMRPSVVFGPQDKFINRFHDMSTWSLALPAIGGGCTNMQPIYVADLVTCIQTCIQHPKPYQQHIYEMGGPDILTFKDILKLILKTSGRRRLIIPIPFWAAGPLAKMTQHFMPWLLTYDQVVLLEQDNIVTDKQHNQNTFNIKTQSLKSILKSYSFCK